LTPEGYRKLKLMAPIETPWVLHISAPWGSNLVSVTVFKKFRISDYDLDL